MPFQVDPSLLDPSTFDVYNQLGISLDDFRELLSQASPDPVTGEIGPEQIASVMIRNFNNPLVQKVGQIAQKAMKERAEEHDPDFNDFDFESLASTTPTNVAGGSMWYISLERFAFANPAGDLIKDDIAPTVPGAQPVFFLNCEHEGIIRLMEQVTGLPNSQQILRFIKRAMVTPVPGLHPCLPRHLQITMKLTQHRPYLQPFLDSLPAPFTWDIDTREVAQMTRDAIDNRMQERRSQYLAAAEAAKAEGNRAFNRQDRQMALGKYKEAIDRAWDAASLRPDTEDRLAAHRLMAVCHANRAATHLLPGEDADFSKALADSQDAEKYDPDYAKGYYRQAKALEALGDVLQAQESLRRALSRPALSGDKTLLSLLNELDVQID
ncbi:hypothetical protein BC835DRAFT_1413251 [Cytidiella melzeri]|nr:hypothetical protein BC835DRAFT_1413251 [Cytidiella melzeri]